MSSYLSYASSFASPYGYIRAHPLFYLLASSHPLFTRAHPVFIPSGKYLISSPLTLRPDAVLIGEGFSVLIANAASPSWTDANTPTPLLSAPAGSVVQLADLMFTASGNVPGCVLLDWQAGAGNGVSGTW